MANDPKWRPRPEDYALLLRDQNPWQRGGRVPETLAPPVERPLASCLWRRLVRDEPRRFQVVLGPRRVGKTTVLYQTVGHLLARGVPAQRLWWFRMDHPLLLEIELGNLVRFVLEQSGASGEAPLYLFLDELTYARSWDLWLKTFHDESWPLRIAATSSSTEALRNRRLESGVGRWEEQYLAPYSLSEALSLLGTPQDLDVQDTLDETLAAALPGSVELSEVEPIRRLYLLVGGFPELLVDLAAGSPERLADLQGALLNSQRTLSGDAVERSVYKDIPQCFGVENPAVLERLLYVLAAQATGVLSPQSICRDLGTLTQPTFDKYLGYLERAFLVFTLQNYSGSERGVQKRGRKLYFVDGAIRNAALQRGLAPLTDPGETGVLLENAAASHLHALARQTRVRAYHWRHRSDEVDLVYDHPDRPLAFEVATSRRHTRRGLQAFLERFPRFRNRVYLVARDAPVIAPARGRDGVGSLPLDLFLLATGAQAQRELGRRIAA